MLKMHLPGKCTIYKIGMTNSNRSTDRMMEILKSWFIKYRFVPYTELKLDMECSRPKELEKFIHKVLSKHQFLPHEKVSGGTEMFIDIDEFRVIQYLKQFNTYLFDNPLDLTDSDYSHLCQLISP